MTSYGVLGLLTFGEMSGYDLVKMAEQTIGHFWTPAKSQVYAELKRLAGLGHVTETLVEQDARPDKRVYAITPEGRGALEDWLADPEFVPDTIRSVTLMKVFFGAHAPRDIIVARLKEVIASNQMKLAFLRIAEEEIKDSEEWLFPYLTLKSGLAHGEATVRWAEESIEMLERTNRKVGR